MNAETIPIVDKMMIRKITPLAGMQFFGGVLLLDEYDVENIGPADARLDYDEEAVDCSNRIFQVTTAMMAIKEKKNFTVFPSRRWREFRTKDEITDFPRRDKPLLYLGNPIRLFTDPENGIIVVRNSEFIIRSGMDIQAKQFEEWVSNR